MQLDTMQSIQFAAFFGLLNVESDLQVLRRCYPLIDEDGLFVLAAIRLKFILFRNREKSWMLTPIPGRVSAPIVSVFLNTQTAMECVVPDRAVTAAMPALGKLTKNRSNHKIGWSELGFVEDGDYYLMIQ